MTISSVGGASQTALSQLYAAQQAQAASAVSVDVPVEDGTDTSAPSTANNLTGSTTASLDSQTLQALLGQQEDPADPSQSAQSSGQSSSQSSGQAQGAKPHHHHHHGGGGMPPASASSTGTSSNPLTATASDPTASAVSDSEDSTDASLESALLAA
jgi:hypothetical protein